MSTPYHSMYWAYALTLRDSGCNIVVLSRSIANAIMSYLQRDVLYALPASQRQHITMVLRKLFALSTFAITRTLRSLAARLENLRDDMEIIDDDDIERVAELAEEYAEDAEEDEEAQIAPDQIAKIEKQLKHTNYAQIVFLIRWMVR